MITGLQLLSGRLYLYRHLIDRTTSGHGGVFKAQKIVNKSNCHYFRIACTLLLLSTCVPIVFAQDFVYTSNGATDDITGYKVNEYTGALIPISGTPWPTGKRPVSLAATPTGDFLYVVNASSNSVSGYSVTPGSGVLTSLGQEFPTGATPNDIAVDPTSRFLYTVNEGGSLSIFSISPGNGKLTPVQGSPFVTGISEYSLALSPTGQSLYAVSNNGPISGFHILRTSGGLQAIAGSPFAGGANLGLRSSTLLTDFCMSQTTVAAMAMCSDT
jgi:6-phosphogluconolactonase (cycloisomerase 2 family)